MSARSSQQKLKALTEGSAIEDSVDYHSWISLEYISRVREHEQDIKKAWDAISNERELIESLGYCDTLVGVEPGQPFTYEMPFLRFMDLREIEALYLAYAALSIENGNPEEGLRQLDSFYTMTRKGLRDASILINKMLWTAIAGQMIGGVYTLSTMDYVDENTHKKLADLFYPLTEEEVAMARTFKGEYLFGRNFIRNEVRPGSFLMLFNRISLCEEPELWEAGLSSAAYFVLFRKNKMMKDYRQYLDHFIEMDQDAADVFFSKYRQNPSLRNFAGWLYLSCFSLDFVKIAERSPRLKTKSDLLSIHLSKRAGYSVVLTDEHTGMPYKLREKNGEIRAPGNDGAFDTDDDVFIRVKHKKKKEPETGP